MKYISKQIFIFLY